MGGTRRTVVIAAAGAAGLLVAVGVGFALSRGDGSESVEPTAPRTTAPISSPPSPPTSPAPTGTSPAPTAATTAPPTTVPATTVSATTVPVPSPPPEAREVPVESLLRPGTEEVRTVYGDLDGDGIEEIVVHSVARGPGPGSIVPQPFLDVFAFRGSGFVTVFDATGPAPDGVDHPATLIRSDDPFVAQQVEFLELVEFRPERPPSLVAGVVVIGASTGPLSLWVLAMDAEGFVTEFFETTQRGGIITEDGATVLLDTGRYAPADPGCCPSRIEHQRIGLDPATGAIAILERTFERT